MKKFKDRFNKVLKALKLSDKAKNDELNQEDWDQITEAYNKKYNSDFYEDQEAAETQERRGSVHQAALNMLNDDDDPTDPDASVDPNETPEMKAARLAQESAVKALKKEQKRSKKLEGKIKSLEQEPEGDDPPTEKMRNDGLGGKTTDKYLFGIQHSVFAMDKRWNKVSANPAVATLEPVDEAEDGSKFQKAVKSFSIALASRFNKLHESGQMANLSAGLDVDYSELANASGDQFLVRRQDALIARILKVPTVYDLFPRRYGVQDRELITNAFFGEFSQAYQEGEIWKGEVDLQPEMGHVDDAMYKTLFKSMKWIERQYIGYLNSEGSDAVKWSMIEWMVLNIAEVLVKEQSQRRIMGIYVKPTAGTPGHKLFASTGVIYTLIRYIHENKILTLDDAAYNSYSNTGTVFIDAVQTFLADALDKRGTLDGLSLHLNRNHKQWFKASVRRLYGKDFDFKGPDANKVPDWDVSIKWVPNMDQNKYMFLQKSGNIQCLEFVPGEMFKIGFDRDMENVKSWSTWKEGVAAAFSGKQFSTIADLIANDYELQEIYINKPTSAMADDDTTCDGTLNFWFRSIENTTEAQNITDITGAADGKAYIIETGHATNPQTVLKAGKFSEITEAFTPVAVGDYLMVHYNTATSKFYDLERKVNGVRSVVAAKQPNIPGAR